MEKQTKDIKDMIRLAQAARTLTTIGSVIDSFESDFSSASLNPGVPGLPSLTSMAFTKLDMEFNGTKFLSGSLAMISTTTWTIIKPTRQLDNGDIDPTSGLEMDLFFIALEVQRNSTGSTNFQMIVDARLSINNIPVGIIVPYNFPGRTLQFILPDAFLNGKTLNSIFAAGVPFDIKLIPTSKNDYDLQVQELSNISTKLLKFSDILGMIPGVSTTFLSSLPSPLNSLSSIAITEMKVDLGSTFKKVNSLSVTMVATTPLLFTENIAIAVFGANVQYNGTSTAWVIDIKAVININTAFIGLTAPFGLPNATFGFIFPELKIKDRLLSHILKNTTTTALLPDNTSITTALATALKLSDIISVFPSTMGNINFDNMAIDGLPNPKGFVITNTLVSFRNNFSDFALAEFEISCFIPWVIVKPSTGKSGLQVNFFNFYLQVRRDITDQYGNKYTAPKISFGGSVFGSVSLNGKILRAFVPFNLVGQIPCLYLPKAEIGDVDLNKLATDPVET